MHAPSEVGNCKVVHARASLHLLRNTSGARACKEAVRSKCKQGQHLQFACLLRIPWYYVVSACTYYVTRARAPMAHACAAGKCLLRKHVQATALVPRTSRATQRKAGVLAPFGHARASNCKGQVATKGARRNTLATCLTVKRNTLAPTLQESASKRSK